MNVWPRLLAILFVIPRKVEWGMPSSRAFELWYSTILRSLLAYGFCLSSWLKSRPLSGTETSASLASILARDLGHDLVVMRLCRQLAGFFFRRIFQSNFWKDMFATTKALAGSREARWIYTPSDDTRSKEYHHCQIGPHALFSWVWAKFYMGAAQFWNLIAINFLFSPNVSSFAVTLSKLFSKVHIGRRKVANAQRKRLHFLTALFINLIQQGCNDPRHP